MTVNIFDQYGIETGIEIRNVKVFMDDEQEKLEIYGHIFATGKNTYTLLEPKVELDIYDCKELLCYTCIAEQQTDFWSQQKASFHICLPWSLVAHMVSWEESSGVLRVVYKRQGE